MKLLLFANRNSRFEVFRKPAKILFSNRNSFSSEFRKEFDQKVFNKTYSSIEEIFNQLVKLQTVGWRQHEQDMRELKSGKFYKQIKRFDKRVKNLIFKRQKQDQFSAEQDQNVLQKQDQPKNNLVTFQYVFNAYPNTKFSISESYLYFFDYYTQIIKKYQQFSMVGIKQTQDFTSRFSSAAFKIRSQEKIKASNQFFTSLLVLAQIQQKQDLQFFSQVLSFSSTTPLLLKLEKVVTNKYLTKYKVLKAYLMYLDRWKSIQQQFSNFVFKDYDLFKEQTASFLFKKVKKYKGDFQFAINQERVFGIPNTGQNIVIAITQVCHILQKVAKFGVLTQLLIKGYWNRTQLMSIRNLSILLKVISIGGRSMKTVDQNLLDINQLLISQKSEGRTAKQYAESFYNLLCYLSLSEYENHIVVNQVFEELQQGLSKNKISYFELSPSPKYSVDWFLYRIVNCIIQCRFDRNLEKVVRLAKMQQQGDQSQENQGQKLMVNQSIKKFLNQFNYRHSQHECFITKLAYYKFYAPKKQQQHQEVQSTTILYPLPSVFFNPNVKVQAQKNQQKFRENVQHNLSNITEFFQLQYTNNGLYKMLMNCIVNQEFNLKKQSLSVYKNKVLKTVNLAALQALEKKGQKDEFIKKKLKGVKSEKVKRQRKFQF